METSQSTKEKILKVDVFGSINNDNLVAKIVEVAYKKAKEMPVIIILKDLKYGQLEDKFEECFVFG